MILDFPFIRKMLVLLSIFTWSITFFSLSSCQSPFVNPEVVSVSNIVITEMDSSLLTLKVTPVVRNGNNSALSISSINAKVFLDGEYLGTGNSETGFEIKPGDTTHIPVLAEIPLQNLMPLLPRIAGRDSVLARVEGQYQLSGLFKINKTTEFYVKPTELIAQQFTLYMQQEGFRIKSLKPEISQPGGEMAVEVQVAARNIYPFELEVHQIAADVYSLPGEKKMFHCTSQDTISLGPRAEEDLALRFTARPSEAMGGIGTLAGIFTKGNQPVKVAGTLQLSAFGATFTLPVEQEVTVSSKDLGLPSLLDIFKHN